MTGTQHEPDLRTDRVRLAYGSETIVEDLDLAIPTGEITVIVGANACGKSTLLKGLGRLLRPVSGSVLLDGKSIHAASTTAVAKVLGLLPQSPTAPEGITVADLVGRGRYPHQGWVRRWSAADDAAVADALESTGTLDLATRSVDELSGGQRQRVWIAMALAQETELLLLDEPTTFLDISHQVEVLDLLAELNSERGRTIVIVLHDLNLGARYAHHLIAMKAGRIVAQGHPETVITEEVVADVFGMRCAIVPDPIAGTPMVVPIGRHHTKGNGLPPDRAPAGGRAYQSRTEPSSARRTG